jgi:DNA mismatch endonuclease (patch repair protein)
VETVWECQMKDQGALKERLAGLLSDPPPVGEAAEGPRGET